MIKVSIVLPMTDSGPGFRNSVESLKKQTLKELEIICVRAESFKEEFPEGWTPDNRIRVVDAETNTIAACLNAGIRAATGQYIVFNAPGERQPQSVYESLYAYAEKEMPDAVVCCNTEKKEEPRPSGKTKESIILDKSCFCGMFKRTFLHDKCIALYESDCTSYSLKSFGWQVLAKAESIKNADVDGYMYMNEALCTNNPGSRGPFDINKTYDFIRDMLKDSDHPERWRNLKGLYLKYKINDYYEVMKSLEGDDKSVFWDRFAGEIKRSDYLGDIDREMLSEEETGMLGILLEYPEEYFLLKQKYRQSERNLAYFTNKYFEKKNELSEIRNSTSFKAGLAVTLIPRKIKDTAKRKRDSNK